MAQPLAPQNPLAEVAALFGKDGLAHKDLNNLTYTIDELVKTLEKRAGKDTSDKKSKKDQDEPRTLKSDVLGFGRGIKDALFADPKNYLMGKSSLPAAVEKIEPVLNDEELTIPEPKQMQAEVKEEVKSIEKINEPELPPTDDNNKVLSDMVGVLIDMRDDKSQLQILNEAVAIKKILTEQNKKTELPGGVEPNSDEAKQEDRERLAEAIARRLGEVLEASGIGGNSGFIPDLPDRNRKPGGKTPNKSGPSKGTKLGLPPGAGKAAMLAGGLASVGGLVYGAYEASEYLKETEYGDKMAEGAGKDAEQAFKNINPDFSKLDITPQQAQDILNQPDSPGKARDVEAFGGENELRKKAGLPSLEASEDYNKPAKVFEQASLRNYDYVPQTSPKVTPKPAETNVGTMLNAVSDQNAELKMFNMRSEQPQMMAPIISNKTINNTEQTIIGTPPTPHSTTNSFLRWQQSRSGFTDSLR